MPGVAEVHLVASSLEGFGVGQNFLPAAGIDVVDAAIDAAADDLAAVLLEILPFNVLGHPAFRFGPADDFDHTFPMASQRDGRHHHAGLAAPPVLHLLVVVEDLAGVFAGGIPGPHRLRGGQAGCHRRGRQGTVAHKLPTRESVCHGTTPSFLTWAFSPWAFSTRVSSYGDPRRLEGRSWIGSGPPLRCVSPADARRVPRFRSHAGRPGVGTVPPIVTQGGVQRNAGIPPRRALRKSCL